MRPGTVATIGAESSIPTRITLDTGAGNGRYIGQAAVNALGPDCTVECCRHRILLGDGHTLLAVNPMVYIDVRLEDNHDELTDPLSTAFCIIPTLGYDYYPRRNSSE